MQEKIVTGTTQQEMLAELILDARIAFETDRHKAKLCIQRALDLIQVRQLAQSFQPRTVVRGGLSSWQMSRVNAFIASNLGARIFTGELATAAQLSIGHFFRSFRASFGATPQSYVMRQRIRRAEELMTTTSEPLARIALEIGMSDQAHFSRAFRRVVGMSPNLWRRQHGSPGSVTSGGTRSAGDSPARLTCRG